MPNRVEGRARALLTPVEIQRVADLFHLQPLIRAHAYNRGSSRFAKAVVVKAGGARFLVKRRIGNPESIARVGSSHSVQRELANRNFPVVSSGRSITGSTWVAENGWVYEVFAFIDGDRYRRSAREARESGLLLARLHRTMRDWYLAPRQSNERGYHQNHTVALSWDLLTARIIQADPAASRRSVLNLEEGLKERYSASSMVVEKALELSASHGRNSILHGDFHPGNVIYRAGTPVALLDFDATRFDRMIFDVANGALQFASLTARRNPVPEWNPKLDLQLVESFLTGYAQAGQLPLHPIECEAVPSLMIESMIAEIVPRLALDGTLDGRPGAEILTFLANKSEWIWSQRSTLTNLCLSCLTNSN